MSDSHTQLEQYFVSSKVQFERGRIQAEATASSKLLLLTSLHIEVLMATASHVADSTFFAKLNETHVSVRVCYYSRRCEPFEMPSAQVIGIEKGFFLRPELTHARHWQSGLQLCDPTHPSCVTILKSYLYVRHTCVDKTDSSVKTEYSIDHLPGNPRAADHMTLLFSCSASFNPSHKKSSHNKGVDKWSRPLKI